MIRFHKSILNPACCSCSSRHVSEQHASPSQRAGEHIGTGHGMKVDIAVDPLDGTSLVAKGRNGAVAVRLPPPSLCDWSTRVSACTPLPATESFATGSCASGVFGPVTAVHLRRHHAMPHPADPPVIFAILTHLKSSTSLLLIQAIQTSDYWNHMPAFPHACMLSTVVDCVCAVLHHGISEGASAAVTR